MKPISDLGTCTGYYGCYEYDERGYLAYHCKADRYEWSYYRDLLTDADWRTRRSENVEAIRRRR